MSSIRTSVLLLAASAVVATTSRAEAQVVIGCNQTFQVPSTNFGIACYGSGAEGAFNILGRTLLLAYTSGTGGTCPPGFILGCEAVASSASGEWKIMSNFVRRSVEIGSTSFDVASAFIDCGCYPRAPD